MHPSNFHEGKKQARFRGDVWWASRGRIHWRNPKTGQHGDMSVREARERMNGLYQGLPTATARYPIFNLAESDAIKHFLNEMEEVCREAERQGTPENPEARKDFAKHFKRRRAQISGSGGIRDLM